MKNNREYTISDYIFSFIYEMALDDATRHVSKSGEKEKIFNNNKIRSIVKKYIDMTLKGEKTSHDNVVNEIVNVVVKDMNKEFHSERLQTFVADTLKMKLEDALKNIDVKLIVS